MKKRKRKLKHALKRELGSTREALSAAKKRRGELRLQVEQAAVDDDPPNVDFEDDAWDPYGLTMEQVRSWISHFYQKRRRSTLGQTMAWRRIHRDSLREWL